MVYVYEFSGSGQFSVWDFSGYEPYFVFYDHFLGDTNCIHVIVFSLLDSPDEQAAQVVFWLNFLRARILPAMPLGVFLLCDCVWLCFIYMST